MTFHNLQQPALNICSHASVLLQITRPRDPQHHNLRDGIDVRNPRGGEAVHFFIVFLVVFLPCSQVITHVSDPSHPAYGQCGLTATRALAPGTLVLDYV